MRDNEDFELAFDRLLGLAYRHARRLVGDAGLAEDLAAEALARTYVRWSKVRSYEFVDAWVLRVVTNLAISAIAARVPTAAVADVIAPDDVAVLRVTLAQALRALPTRQRDAVV